MVKLAAMEIRGALSSASGGGGLPPGAVSSESDAVCGEPDAPVDFRSKPAAGRAVPSTQCGMLPGKSKSEPGTGEMAM